MMFKKSQYATLKAHWKLSLNNRTWWKYRVRDGWQSVGNRLFGKLQW